MAKGMNEITREMSGMRAEEDGKSNISIMIRKIAIAAAATVIAATLGAAAQEKTPAIYPDGTYMFAERDTCELFMDVYNPAEGSETSIGGKEKPTVIFVFGGGFISGTRNDPWLTPWYKEMTDNGYRIIAIDYRLGLKGADKVGIGQVDILDKAIHLAVEDLYSATEFIIENAETLGVEPDNMVISGSSAGAITVLQADYELSNGSSYAASLPEGFRYAGVMSFSGGILSRKGKLKYREAPAPTLMLHGTDDKLVNYRQIKFFNLGFFGSDKIAERFARFGYNYNILRYLDCGHEIAAAMDVSTAYQFKFLEDNVMKGLDYIVDMTVDDPSIIRNGSQSRKELYGGR